MCKTHSFSPAVNGLQSYGPLNIATFMQIIQYVTSLWSELLLHFLNNTRPVNTRAITKKWWQENERSTYLVMELSIKKCQHERGK